MVDGDQTTVVVQVPRRGSSTGTASLVLGILGLLICWVPFLNVLGMPLSALGLLLGGIGLLVAALRRGSGIGFPIAGLAVSGLALFVALGVTKATVKAIDEVDRAIDTSRRKAQATNQKPVGDAALGQGRASGSDEQPAQVTWAPADSPVRQGDLEVEVVSAIADHVSVEDLMAFSESGRVQRSKDVLLAISIKLTNRGSTRKIDYRTWAGGDFSISRDYGSLADNFGNTYKRIGFGSTSRPVGSIRSESIYPGSSVTDLLVFQRPLDNMEYLRLELPAENFGGTGYIRLQIPRTLVTGP